MSAQYSRRAPNRPRWLNIAAVAGLIAFLAAGYLMLRQLGSDAGEPDEAPATTRFDADTTPVPRVVRPGEQPGPVVLAGPHEATGGDEFLRLAETNPKAAAAIVARMPDTPDRDERMFDLMQIWVQKDPTQAADWVGALPYSEMKDHATAELGLAWGKLDPQAASIWVDENIFTENAPAGASSLVSSWSRSDIEAASEWVASLDVDAPARTKALQALAYHLGELDPKRGLAWLTRLAADDRNLTAVNFAASWADSDPRAAADWLRYQSADIDPKIRDQATLAVIHSWAADEHHAASASKWIDSLADGTLKENAKATFAESHAETSPAEALPWALDIRDDERRNEVTMVVLEEWILQDKEGFKVGITDRWESYDEPLRHEIYDLLLDHDPDFKEDLFQMFENSQADENGNS